MLIDDVTVTLKAGNGGNGAATFRRNAQTAKGGPDGGNGGNGGNVYIQGVNDISALADFQYKKKILAEDGIKGSKQNKYGRNGTNITITIPIGSTITDTQTNETWEVPDDQTHFMIALGGVGGRGNNEFKTATNQTPTFAEEGEPGQERIVRIVMSIIADIGFIGLPNAGKSSLLKALTNANPKIGAYPFTTLEPNLGVMTKNEDEEEDHIIIADIPGLIEGASKGKGLGIKFLKHVEKTDILIHCIDSSTENIREAYETIRKELDAFSQTLANKKELLLLTKTDLIAKEELEEKIKEAKKLKKNVYTVSVYNEESLSQFRSLLQNQVKK